MLLKAALLAVLAATIHPLGLVDRDTGCAGSCTIL